MNSVNVDLAVKYIKTIADNSRCVSCDQLEGVYVRYPCGHSACENCVIWAEDCLLCLSPPNVSSHVIDDPLSLHVHHASNLLNYFQDLFKLDVYRRQRISDQLKLEKQLFPECIQAPSKYSNNRRSINTSIKNKENLNFIQLPVDNTSLSKAFKMENKMNYVQQWLNKNNSSHLESNFNLPRKPFTDLNVNSQYTTKPKITNKATKRKKVSNKKRTHFKTFDCDVQDKSKLSLKRKKDVEMKLGNESMLKCAKYESGINKENDIVSINDSQSYCNEKDRLACLAVIEADKNNHCDMTNSKAYQSDYQEVINTGDIDKSIQGQRALQSAICKIPFFKKSSLVKMCTCVQCVHQWNERNNDIIPNSNETKNITIIIDNSTIKFLLSDKDKPKAKSTHSIEVQTEDRIDFGHNSNSCSESIEPKLLANENKNKKDKQTFSSSSNNVKGNVDMLKEIAVMKEIKKHSHQPVQKSKCLIIEDSDTGSDSIIEKDSLLEVTAEVHRSESEIASNVLCQLEQGEYEHRMQHAVRGRTPASTDSSDKENYDPNRAKRKKLDKKCPCKKY